MFRQPAIIRPVYDLEGVEMCNKIVVRAVYYFNCLLVLQPHIHIDTSVYVTRINFATFWTCTLCILSARARFDLQIVCASGDKIANCLSVVTIYVQSAIFGGSGESQEIL